MSEFEFFSGSYPPQEELNPGGSLTAPGAKTTGRGGFVPLLPFFAFVGTFLGVPTFALFARASRSVEGSSTPAMLEAIQGQFRGSFLYSAKVSAVSAVLGVLVGTLFALAVTRISRPRWFRNVVTGFSGVAANLGGIPLAFAFIATLGTQGLVTRILFHWGVDLYGHGFTITGFWGIVTVYLYFQIPLMFLVIVPSIDGLRPTWAEACANLGGNRRQYWRRIGIPLLAPSLMGGGLLLFANAFSAYATAYALSSGGSKLVPVQIRFFLQGNTITGKGNLGYALAAWMIIILTVIMGGYLVLRRRAELWRA